MNTPETRFHTTRRRKGPIGLKGLKGLIGPIGLIGLIWSGSAQRINRAKAYLLSLAALSSLPLLLEAAPAPIEIENVTILNNPVLIFDLNGDGSIAVGSTGGWPSDAVRWTQDGGLENLTFPDGLFVQSSDALATSISGNFIAGSFTDFMNSRQAFVSNSGIVTPLGFDPLNSANAYDDSVTTDISGDGQVVVGLVSGPQLEQRGFIWSSGTGMNLLELPAGALSSMPSAVNESGTVTVGSTDVGTEAVWWAGSGVGGVLPGLGGFGASARDVDRSGTIIVGSAGDPDRNGSPSAVIWRRGIGEPTIERLDSLPELTYSVATGVSGSGSEVVGQYYIGKDSSGFYWSNGTMMTIEDWLKASGVAVGEDFAQTADNISDDGKVIAGYTDGGDQYIAKSGRGAVTVNSFFGSIQGSNARMYDFFRTMRLVFSGAHSQPLNNRTEPGENVFWTAGDWGSDNHGDGDGHSGLAELGFGRNFGSVQLNASIGMSRSRDQIDSDSEYFMIEAMRPITESMWGVLTAYHYEGSIDGSRDYLNAGLPDASFFETDGHGTGLRARLEWPGLWQLGATSINPFAQASHFITQIDGFTETGGGFPATVDEIDESITQMNFGLNLETELSDTLTLTAIIELVHQPDDKSPRITGSVAGLGGYSFPGQEIENTWGRAGLGFKKQTDMGEFSLMLNGTTEGQALDTWLATAFRVKF